MVNVLEKLTCRTLTGEDFGLHPGCDIDVIGLEHSWRAHKAPTVGEAIGEQLEEETDQQITEDEDDRPPETWPDDDYSTIPGNNGH